VEPIAQEPEPTPEPKPDDRAEGEAAPVEGDRGEDHRDVEVPEGSEDARGQGHFRPEDQQAASSAIAAQKSEAEVAAERDEARQEVEELNIKDLQERLAILARENEEKDKRIFKLEEDLRDTTSKLRDTERKLFASEASGGADAPKSKTCAIM